jgi:hypothetical protein
MPLFWLLQIRDVGLIGIALLPAGFKPAPAEEQRGNRSYHPGSSPPNVIFFPKREDTIL